MAGDLLSVRYTFNRISTQASRRAAMYIIDSHEAKQKGIYVAEALYDEFEYVHVVSTCKKRCCEFQTIGRHYITTRAHGTAKRCIDCQNKAHTTARAITDEEKTCELIERGHSNYQLMLRDVNQTHIVSSRPNLTPSSQVQIPKAQL